METVEVVNSVHHQHRGRLNNIAAFIDEAEPVFNHLVGRLEALLRSNKS